MKDTSYTTKTAELIVKGRSIQNQPYAEKMVGFKNIAEVLARNVQKAPSKVFLTSVKKEYEIVNFTYKEFYAKVCRLANVLVDEFDVQENDRVSSIAYNHEDTVTLMFACWMVGACYVPINVGEDDDRVTFVHNNSNVKVCFVMPDVVPRVKGIMPEFETVSYFVVMSKLPTAGFQNLPQLLDDVHDLFNHTERASLETEALIVYTSGTTGTPKGVLLQQYNCLVDAENIMNWYGFTEDDKAMLVLPIHHVNGIIVTLLTPLVFGGSVVLNDKFSASNYWQILKEHGCTYGSVVPTILSFLCEAGDEHFVQPNDGYFLICGAGPLTIESAKRFDRKFGIKVNHGYGLSETTCYSCYLPHDLERASYENWMYNYGYPSIGVALPCNEMDIHDAEGNTVAEGEKGEIVIRGHNVMSCYYKRPDANAEAFEFGWFRSGDEGFYKLDEKGQKYFFITGRLKELIIRGGVNYSPLEIDEVINSIEGVKAGMAVGFSNNMYGEEIAAYVVLEKGAILTEDDILTSCESLPFNKRPKVVVIGNDFPITSTGKYQRNKLKHLFTKWQDVQFSEG